ncbi:MAG: hypothetical protein R8P61_37350 [Bacteroidia bacterium]|nr:hypothetical protein [Bacteroidia bacterium]
MYLTSGISLIGQISDKVLFWTWLILTAIVIIKYFKRRLIKGYLVFLGILLMLSLFPMALPFLSIFSFATENDYEVQIENYRLREGVKSAIAIPKIYLLQEWGFLEKEIGETNFTIEIDNQYYKIDEIEEISLSEEKDSLSFEFRLKEKSAYRKFKKE